MRVSFILPAYYDHPIGGHRVVYEYSNYLAERGHCVSVLYPRLHAGAERERRRRVSDLMWPLKMRLEHRPVVGWQHVDRRVKLRFVPSLAASNVPDGDVVFATACQTASIVAQLPKRKGRGFYLVQDLEAWEGRTEKEVRATYRLGLATVAVSRWLADLVSSEGANVVHIPNAVDHCMFRVRSPPAGRSGVLSLFHHDERKGVNVALSALGSLHAKRPDVPVTMFGVPSRPAILPEWVQYSQSPAAHELATLYNDHAIYLSASRVEGWGLPPAEAMACGCLFVGTDSKGVRDFAEDGVSALLSDADDSFALAENLLRAVENVALRRRLQLAGLASIKGFTWSESGRKLESFIAGPRGLSE